MNCGNVITQLDDWDYIMSILENVPRNEEEFVNLVSSTLKNKEKIAQSLLPPLKTFFNRMKPEDRDKFFTSTLPGIINLAKQLPELFKIPIPILKIYKSGEVTLSRHQVACILAHGFLGTFKSDEMQINMPSFNFRMLYIASGHAPQEEAKLLCIIHYFERILEEMPKGDIKVTRLVIRDFPDFSKSKKPLTSFTFSDKLIEDCTGALQVDFANKYIGGGVLCGGCVQEEIRFAVCTELIACCLFCEKMENEEAIIISGFEQFSAYSGYAFGLKYAGDYVDKKKNTLCAIDAVDYRMFGLIYQYKQPVFTREIKKAYIGFYSESDKSPIATGNWGCGAFLGNIPHKSIIQYIAASEAGRDLIYCCFNKKDAEEMKKFINFLSNMTQELSVSDLWNILVKYETFVMDNNLSVYEFAIKELNSMNEDNEIFD